MCQLGFFERARPTLTSNRGCSNIKFDDAPEPEFDEDYVRSSIVLGNLPDDFEFDDKQQNILLQALYRTIDGVDSSATINILSFKMLSSRRRSHASMQVDYVVVTERGKGADVAAELKQPATLLNNLQTSQAALGETGGIGSGSVDDTNSKVADTSTEEPNNEDDGGSDSSLVIIIAAAAGGVVLIAIIIIVVVLRRRRSSAGADISAYADDGEFELSAIATAPMKDDAAAFADIKRTRQSSFYSSIALAEAEA